MLARDGPTPGDHLGKEGVEGGFDFFRLGRLLLGGDHDIDMDIAITGMTKAGDLKAGFLLEPLGKLDEIDQSPARHGDVLVELGQPRRFQRGGEGAAQGPHPIAPFRRGGQFDFEGFIGSKECLQRFPFA